MLGLTGISHVTITVTDLVQARWFWTEVMRLELVVSSDSSIVCVDRETRLAVGCRTHAEQASPVLDERNVGLDHLAFGVADRRALGFALDDAELPPNRWPVRRVCGDTQ